MKLVYIVMRNADQQEGRGPMLVHSVYGKLKKAQEFVEAQPGIYGSKQRLEYADDETWSYNGWAIFIQQVR